MAKDIKITIIKEIGIISETKNSKIVLGITEVNGVEKYDLRGYYKKKDSDEWQFGKGIRLTEEELFNLGDLIKKVK